MLKRFWKAVERSGYCVTHNITSSPVCSRCGYNIEKPIVVGKDRKKSQISCKQRRRR